jgi:hypothetical protein
MFLICSLVQYIETSLKKSPPQPAKYIYTIVDMIYEN